MQNKIKTLFILLAVYLISGCITPSNPVGIQSENVVTIDTEGYCLDIAIKDSLIIAAADENGYQIYRFSFQENGEIEYEYMYGQADLNVDGMNNPVENVLVSEKHNFFFIMDYFDAVYSSNLNHSDHTFRVGYEGSENRDWVRSMTMNEELNDRVVLYTLNKNEDGISTYISIRIFDPPFIDDFSIPGDSLYSFFWPEIQRYDGLNIESRDIFYADSLLTVANSQLGVIVLKQSSDALLEFGSFDTPGEVNEVYSVGNVIFAGLSDAQGCYMALLDSNGNILHTLRIANGYSVKGIHEKDGILALACGSDGSLLYEWDVLNEELMVEELGILNSGYAYEVKVYDPVSIFVCTRNGIQIFQLER